MQPHSKVSDHKMWAPHGLDVVPVGALGRRTAEIQFFILTFPANPT